MVSQTITKETVNYIAKLSKLDFTDKESEQLSNELDRIFNYINKLNELNTDNIEPTSHVLDIQNVMRSDEVVEKLTNEDALKNAPQAEKGHFKVPRVIE
jgi:aspartyl-tRNA(Asn)/glutamyl-tRNA(Gln) amidotransferase subunit C